MAAGAGAEAETQARAGSEVGAEAAREGSPPPTPWKTDRWFVSPWNFDDEVTGGLAFPDTVRLHDVSLRDGEQQAGIVLTREDKVRIARGLADVGIHRIEAGMPAVSPDDEAAVKDIVQLNLGPQIFCFSRGTVGDVKKAADCGVSGIVIEIPSSDHIIKYGYGWTVDKALKLSVEATQYAKQAGLYTVFFPVDATRAELNWFLDHIERIATEGHMDALAVADTFGVCSSHAIPYAMKKVRERIKKPLEAHFHNDFGLSVANTLQAIAAGASVVHTTVGGIGERSGNAGYEEVALALRTLYGKDCGIRFERMYGLSQLVRGACRLQANRPIVGDDLFTLESGIVVNIWRKCREHHLLEILTFVPELVGHRPVKVALGKKSGLESVNEWLEELGAELEQPQKQALLVEVKRASIAKKALLTMEEFKALLAGVAAKGNRGDGGDRGHRGDT